MSSTNHFNRFEKGRNLWIATVRPDGRPHLTPVWFVVSGEKIFICITGKSVKTANLTENENVACSLEDGSQPLICEGRAAFVSQPWPENVQAAFKQKYEWDLPTDHEYNVLVEILPIKWLTWN